MESTPRNPDAFPNLPADFYAQQINTFLRARSEHMEVLRGMGTVDKAYHLISTDTRARIRNAVVEPSIYANKLRVLLENRYSYDNDRSEEGICFRVALLNLAGRTQYEKICVPVAFVEAGIVFPRNARQAQFTDEEAKVVHHFAETLADARQNGTLPHLSRDCTDISDKTVYEQ